MRPRTQDQQRPSWRRIAALLLTVAVVAILALSFSADAHAASTVTHVVAPGERLASIARQYCTTWQEIYDLNRGTIGSNPDYLPAGTALTVIDRCSHGGGVYDRGPTTHARGTVSGSTYYVYWGDTIFSIANRFGVDEYTLMRANGIHNPVTLQAGSTLTIPGLGPVWPTPVPTHLPWPTPTPTSTPSGQPYVEITNPAWETNLPSTFSVSGRGGRLYEGNVVVQAKDRHGAILAEQATTLQGYNMGTGGEGTFSVQLAVNVAANTPGVIVAFSPGSSSATDSVDVVYNGGGSGSYVAITEPVSGASLPTTFTARGTGRGLFEGNVVVRAEDWNGRILAEVATTLQDANVGVGGEGTWSVQMNVNVSTDGRIVASSPGSGISDSVKVRFNGAGPGPGPSHPVKDFYPGECVVRPRAGAPAYGYPAGPQRETFPGGTEYNAIRGVYVDGLYWYYVKWTPDNYSPALWVKRNDLDGERGACTW